MSGQLSPRARFVLSQELFRIGRYLEARTEIDELLRTVQPDGTPKVTPSVLCRYSDYQGRILESLGDMTGAQQAYLKAIDLDPTYAPPVLQLSRWGVLTGNRDQAEALLRDAIERSRHAGKANFAGRTFWLLASRHVALGQAGGFRRLATRH